MKPIRVEDFYNDLVAEAFMKQQIVNGKKFTMKRRVDGSYRFKIYA